MDGVTLLDARTTRAHFALARSLEDAPTPGVSDVSFSKDWSSEMLFLTS